MKHPPWMRRMWHPPLAEHSLKVVLHGAVVKQGQRRPPQLQHRGGMPQALRFLGLRGAYRSSPPRAERSAPCLLHSLRSQKVQSLQGAAKGKRPEAQARFSLRGPSREFHFGAPAEELRITHGSPPKGSPKEVRGQQACVRGVKALPTGRVRNRELLR